MLWAGVLIFLSAPFIKLKWLLTLTSRLCARILFAWYLFSLKDWLELDYQPIYQLLLEIWLLLESRRSESLGSLFWSKNPSSSSSFYRLSFSWGCILGWSFGSLLSSNCISCSLQSKEEFWFDSSCLSIELKLLYSCGSSSILESCCYFYDCSIKLNCSLLLLLGFWLTFSALGFCATLLLSGSFFSSS